MTAIPSRTESPPVAVLLDLRNYRSVPDSVDGYLRLWKLLEPSLGSVDPRRGTHLQFDLDADGVIGLWFLDPFSAPLPLNSATRFAVRGILEPPRVMYACDTCRAAGTDVYAPFLCTGCGTGERPGRVCDDHVVLLEGSLRSSCPRHVPACRCGRPAQAWCSGAKCRSARAWCTDHLRQHPGSAAIRYCSDCYTEKFPVCERAGCVSTGHIRCEYHSSTHRCERRMCAKHTMRWQIYGSRSQGIALCAQHQSSLASAPPQFLVELILAVTVSRSERKHGRGPRRQAFLPRLSTIRHIFINTCKKVFDIHELDTLFAGLHDTARTQWQGTRRQHALRILDEHRSSRREDVKRSDQRQDEGRRHFDRLREILVRSGRQDLAASVQFSDFSKHNILFVRLPASLKGLFIGRGGATVKQLKQELGVDIRLERE